jgi:hypothetical protein
MGKLMFSVDRETTDLGTAVKSILEESGHAVAMRAGGAPALAAAHKEMASQEFGVCFINRQYATRVGESSCRVDCATEWKLMGQSPDLERICIMLEKPKVVSDAIKSALKKGELGDDKTPVELSAALRFITADTLLCCSDAGTIDSAYAIATKIIEKVSKLEEGKTGAKQIANQRAHDLYVAPPKTKTPSPTPPSGSGIFGSCSPSSPGLFFGCTNCTSDEVSSTPPVQATAASDTSPQATASLPVSPGSLSSLPPPPSPSPPSEQDDVTTWEKVRWSDDAYACTHTLCTHKLPHR